jgi:hypothetical protein
MAALKRLMV